MENSEVKTFVKKRYSDIAKTEKSCCQSSCCGLSTTAIALQIGYSEGDLKDLPEDTLMGLGCGNPVALV